jgi:Glycosyl transferases group 1
MIRGRISVPALATITDFAGVAFWSHPGIDLHLVMHPSLVPVVEREAGRGSACAVAPLAARAFREASRLPRAARESLDLPTSDRVVVISGGGWGVGDIEGAVSEASALEATTVVAVTGHNAALEAKLQAAYRDTNRVRVLGFTDAMPRLLAAADVLVHTTGGVTCLEALTAGCPLVAYGAPAGHAPSLARAMAEQRIALHPKNRGGTRSGRPAAFRATPYPTDLATVIGGDHLYRGRGAGICLPPRGEPHSIRGHRFAARPFTADRPYDQGEQGRTCGRGARHLDA